MTYTARPYQYLNKAQAQGGRFTILNGRGHGVGGALAVGGGFIAYAGQPGDGTSPANIKKYADKWVEAADLHAALAAIKPHLEG